MEASVLKNSFPSSNGLDFSLEYRPINGFPHYLIGSDGSVWSEHEHGPKAPRGRWHRRLLYKNEFGYFCVGLYRDGNRRSVGFKVHRLVAEAFLGPCPEGLEVCHNNGIKTDNRPSNLRYDTHKANGEDASRHGSWSRNHGKKGVTNPSAKLNTRQVAAIRRLAADGVARKDVAALFEVSYSLVSKIVTQRLWT